MITIAVTGGVACGKSAFCRRFNDWVPEGRGGYFNCDEEVRKIVAEPEIQAYLVELASGVGASILSGGLFNKEAFRDLVFENARYRAMVEGLLHPLVRIRVDERRSTLAESAKLFLVEVPLLYEVDFPLSRELDVVVGASREMQENRLTQTRGLQAELARKILMSQLPITEKVRKAHIVVWNDGNLDSFHFQIDHLALRCQSLFLND